MSAATTARGASALRQRWQALAPRERLLIAFAVTFVVLALLWWVALAPALATLRAAPARHQALDAQLAQMRGLQAQARAMQAQPRQAPEDTQRALEAAARQHLGTAARVSVAGERVTLTLAGVRGDAFAQWLAATRVNARVVPAEARLTRNANGLWDGTVVLALPPR